MRNELTELDQRFSELLHKSLSINGLAVVIGLASGVAAVGFRWLLYVANNLFFYQHLSIDFRSPIEHELGWLVILIPALGGVFVGLITTYVAPEVKGHGVPEVMEAIAIKGGRIRPVVVLAKALASAFCIGSGGSSGREGPIVQMGSAAGSALGQYFDLESNEIKILVGCGAGAGIAATFNTPLGAVLFAVELMLPEFSARTLMPVVLATGTATYVGRLAFGVEPAFLVASHEYPDLFVPLGADILPLYILTGVLCGFAAALFVKTLYATEDLFDRVNINPYLKTTIGMAGIGTLLYVLMLTSGQYHTAGVGYGTIQQILTGQITAPGFLLLLFALKLLATSVSLAAGASGGVFSPTLFTGAALGAAFGALLDMLFPALGFNPVIFALIGMAGLVGASTGAALTSILMIFEMTGDYETTLPAIIAVVVAVGIRRGLMTDNIYTMKLTRRGHHVPRESRSHMFPLRKVGDVMEPVVGTVEESEIRPMEHVKSRGEGKRNFAVVMQGRHIVGVVAVDAERHDHAIGPVLKPVGIVGEASFLRDAMVDMSSRGHIALVVVPKGMSPRAENMVGVVTRIAIADSVLADYRN